MATGKEKASLANKNLVFYNRLATDFNFLYLGLYRKVVSRLEDFLDDDFSPESNVSYVRKIATIERTKEIQAIRKIFQGKIPSLENLEDIDERRLVHLMNVLLNDYQLFQRNLAVITQSKGGVKSTAAFFSFYLRKAFEDGTFIDSVLSDPQFLDAESLMDTTIFVEVLRKHTKQVIDLALEKMANAGVETGIDKENRGKYTDAYKGVVGRLEQLVQDDDPYVQEIARTYELDKIYQEMAEEIATIERLTAREIRQIGAMVDFNVDARGRATKRKSAGEKAGVFREVLGKMVVNLRRALEIHMKNDLFEMDGKISDDLEAFQVGGFGGADDMIASIGIPDIADLLPILGTNPSKLARLKNMAKFCEHLQQYKDGLIIHISSKDYTLNQDFRGRGGYHTTTMDIPRLEAALVAGGDYNPDITYAILQLCKGAIGDTYNAQVSASIAKYFSYFFFDDAMTIGEDLAAENRGATAIHMMYLNGVQVPLSVFLFSFADAIQEAAEAEENTAEGFVKVRINAPSIKYPKANMRTHMQDWYDQEEEAIEGIKIYVNFFKNIQDFMKGIV